MAERIVIIMIELNSESFKKEVLETKGVILVDFWAAWCGPCRMIAPVLNELSKETEKIKFFKVNVDENPELADEYKIRSIPTMILFKDGVEEERFIGFSGKDIMRAKLAKYM